MYLTKSKIITSSEILEKPIFLAFIDILKFENDNSRKEHILLNIKTI